MTVQIGRPRDAIAGALFVIIGTAAWLGAQQYRIGTATRMGPGYFPMCLGMLLVGLGAINLLRSLAPGEGAVHEPRALTPLLLIVAGVAGFTLLVDRAGLVPAIAVLVGFACAPQLLRRPLEVVLIFVVLAAFSVAVFIDAFSLPLRAF